MEEAFLSENLEQSPVTQGFEVNKFQKKNNHLNIPDTIPEQSGESNASSPSSKVSKISIENCSTDEISENFQSSKSDESSASTIIPFDQSLLMHNEKELLELSTSDQEKNSLLNQSLESNYFSTISRKLGFNDTISTPPNELRQQIHVLSDELTKSDEFHDLEIAVLKEILDENCFQWFEKYTALMESYTSLKKECEAYQKEQERVIDELHCKTADCLENLCSQIEASDSSLNFSDNSIASFNTDIRSSTVVGNITEREMTLAGDNTLMASDPLALSTDGIFKTPVQTPLQSCKKILSQGSCGTRGKSLIKKAMNLRDVFQKQDNSFCLSSEKMVKLSDVQSALFDKMRKIEELNERLFKVEAISNDLQNECDRITIALKKENNQLKDSLTKKTEELDELIQKLITETIALNPSLQESLINIPPKQILCVFIKTIMESCKDVQDNLIKNFNAEKSAWNEQKNINDKLRIEDLENQLKILENELSKSKDKMIEFESLNEMYKIVKEKCENAEIIISRQDEEIRSFQSRALEINKVQEDLNQAQETITKLQYDLAISNNKETEMLNAYLKLVETIVSPDTEIKAKEIVLSKLKIMDLSHANTKGHNENLEVLIKESEELVSGLINELDAAKKESILNSELRKEMELIKEENGAFKNLIDVLRDNKTYIVHTYSSISSDFNNIDQEVVEKIKPSLRTKDSEEFLCLVNKTILQCCKNLQERLDEDFENKTGNILKNLQNETEILNSKIVGFEAAALELDNLKEKNAELQKKIKEAEDLMFKRDEEFRCLQLRHAEELKFEAELSEVRATVDQLQAKLEVVENEREKIATKCKELEETNLSLESEVSAKDIILKNLEKTMIVHEEIKVCNESLKAEIKKLEEVINDQKNELNSAEKYIICNEKLENENNYLKSLKDTFRGIFDNLRDNKKHIADLYSNFSLDSIDIKADLPNLIVEKIKPPAATDSESDLFVTLISETISDCGKCLLQKLIEEFEEHKAEWKKLKETDQKMIENLQNQTNTLNAKIKEFEVVILDLESVKEKCEDLKKELEEAETKISMRDEKISSFELREIQENKIQWELTTVQANVEQLQKNLTVAENEKLEVINKCKELEKEKTVLELEIREKENIIENLRNSVSCYEEIKLDNYNLNVQIKELQEVLGNKKDELESAKRCIDRNDELLNEMNAIKNKNIALGNAINALSDNKKYFSEFCSRSFSNLKDSYTDTDGILEQMMSWFENSFGQSQMIDMSCPFSEIISEYCKSLGQVLMNEFQSHKCDWEKQREIEQSFTQNLKNQIKSLEDTIAEQKSAIIDLQNFKEMYETLKNQMCELEVALSKRDDEIRLLHLRESDNEKTQKKLETAEDNILQLRSQLTLALNEKMEILNKCKHLEGVVDALEAELKAKEIVLADLEKSLSLFEDIKHDNVNLKEQKNKSEEVAESLKIELDAVQTENRKLKNIFEVLHDNENVISESNLNESPKPEDAAVRAFFDKVTLATKNSLNDTTYEKFLSIIEETIKNCCNSVKHRSFEVFQDEKAEWEKQKKEYLNSIENLQNEKKSLDEDIRRFETIVSELKHFKEMHDILKEEMKKAEVIILKREKEICSLQTYESLHREIQTNYVLAQETIGKLQALLMVGENEKKELVNKCQKLQDTVGTLESEMKAKETVLKNLENSLASFEQIKNNNEHMKEIIKQSEEIITDLRKELNQNVQEIESLKKENNRFKNMLEMLKDNKKNLADMYSDVSFNLMNGADIDVNVISDKIKSFLENSFNETESETLLSVICETIFDCCNSLKQQLTKERDREKSQWEIIIEKLKVQIEVLSSEKDLKETRVAELSHKVELLENEKEKLVNVTDKMKVLENEKKNLTDILSDIQSCLDMPSDTFSKMLSGDFENRKIFSESINAHTKIKTEILKVENLNLKVGNDNLKEKVMELSKIIDSLRNRQMQDETILNNSLPHSKVLRNSSLRNVDLCTRRLDKLEEINHNLMELIIQILTMTEFPNLDKLKFMSVRDYPNITKKVFAHFNRMDSKYKELEAANVKLDEECDSYSKTIMDLKKEAVSVWKSNKEKMEALEEELRSLKEAKNVFEGEKKDLLTKISKLEGDCQRLKDASKPEGSVSGCSCASELKKVQELKRTILIKEQKILELQDLNHQSVLHKSQIKYLENALEQEKKKIRQEREKNKKLQNEIAELSKNQTVEKKKADENDILEELRMGGSVGGGIVQEFVDKEKMRKLSKDIGILKELCRARYAEIKRLEAENASLKSATSKNSNQMDSPLRVKAYNTRSKKFGKEIWTPEVDGKENDVRPVF